jgi:peptide-methionine (R)-S-oxide reductase
MISQNKIISGALFAGFLVVATVGCRSREAEPGEGRSGVRVSGPVEDGRGISGVGDAEDVLPRYDREGRLKKIEKSDAEWKRLLTPEQYRITREGGTELPGENAYWNHKGDGVYGCVACGLLLFSSEAKYGSGTGWPSFYQPADGRHVDRVVDRSHSMVRTEVVCGRCGAHLGHVFEDGPEPTGLRYCINSAALRFRARALEK